MSLLDATWLSEIHREVYVAILRAWIPHGRRGEFANRVGISREYLSYLCALDHPAEGKYPTLRLPSPQMAQKIATALPAPTEIRFSLMENMTLAHVNAAKAYYVSKEWIHQQRVGNLLTELEQAHRQATFGGKPGQVKRAYRTVRNAAASLLPSLSPTIYPASFAQTCLYLHDAQCVLNRADDALRYAKLARLVLESQDVHESGFNRKQVADLEINAIRGEAVAYHNLGLDREVPRLNAHACTTTAYRESGEFWRPLVGRDMLNAMVQIPRFRIREAKKLAGEIRNICERKGDEFTLLLVNESWLRCLIRREKWKQAQRVYEDELERFERLAQVGYLHQALLLKSGAWLAWQLKDITTWERRIGDTLTLMHRAGLEHQLDQVRMFYGPALESVWSNFESYEHVSL
ncbi:hypothetical protein ACFLZW_02120 [Chloroflexota bacterium]